jgi:hypothetical protein
MGEPWHFEAFAHAAKDRFPGRARLGFGQQRFDFGAMPTVAMPAQRP